MSDFHGRFVWYEMMTTDLDAAKAFYGKVVGWATQDAQMPGMTYLLLMAGKTSVGGLMTLPEEAHKMGAIPGWMGHIGVDDVDATAEKAKSLGGAVLRAPADIPNVGRFAILRDPGGAVFSIFKWSKPPEQPQNPDPGAPGHIGWHELLATDWPSAFDFYTALFGWKKSQAMDMGAIGTYQIFSHGGRDIGGMFNKPAMIPRPYWLFYINVPGIDAAVERMTSGGGKILHGPVEVPGGNWIVNGMDPQGAMFALVGKKA